MFVKIKGKKYKIIKRNGILVYKKPRCHCGCNERIHFPLTVSGLNNHKYGGIPEFIHGHSRKGKYNYNAILSEPTIIIDGIKVYRDYICHCENKDDINCGLHIPFPITESGLKNHKLRGIPKFIKSHSSKETREKQSKAVSGILNPNYGKPILEKQKEMISKSKKKFYRKHPELVERIIENLRKVNWKGGLKAYSSRRRELGFEPFNEEFEYSSPHHLDHDFVIFIPRKLHETYRHRQDKPKSMKLINQIAFEFYGFQSELKHYHGIKDDNLINKYSTDYITKILKT